MAMTKKELDFGAWEPDMAKYNGNQACEAYNVLPTKRGYKSMPSLVELKQFPALDSRALGAITVKGTDGQTVLTIVATSTGIYTLESRTWVQKLNATLTEYDAYNAEFALYGNSVYAIFGDTLYKADINDTTVTSFYEVSGAPKGKTLTVIQDFLCVGRLNDYTNGIHWSAIDDPTDWPEVGTDEAVNKQSDIQIFPDGGKVQAVTGGLSSSVTSIVFLDRSIYLATYVGSPYIFQFSPIERSRGLLAPKSAVVAGSLCVFLAEDGWRITDGESTKSIGKDRINDWFFAKADPIRMIETVGVHDGKNNLIFWAFASNECSVEKQYDCILVYDYINDRWSWGDFDAELIYGETTRSITLEDLDIFLDAAGNPNIDELGFSLDSPGLRANRSILGAVNHRHMLAVQCGMAREAIITTQEQGGDRFMLHGLRPLVDRGDAEALPLYRNRQQDVQRFGKYTKQQRDGVCYQHISTVYISGQIRIPAGEHWNNAIGVEALVETEGGM